MSISSLVTQGYSNGSFVGSISSIVTIGYSISEAVDLVGYLNGELAIYSAYNGIVLTQATFTGVASTFNSLDLN